MIDYLLKSTLCLVILLAVYHAFLEWEKMHRFNRYFLLASLVLSLVIPLITLKTSIQPMQPIALNNFYDNPNLISHLPVNIQTNSPAASSNTFDTAFIIMLIYSAGVILLVYRFVNNVYQILSSVAHHSRVKVKEGVIVLIKEKILPHTFLTYIFFNEEDYINQGIDDKLFIHEVTHVTQKHSLDILLIELFQIVFWFNPVFILYKKAIRLNHEFLADEAVINSCNDVSCYQQLLLSKVLQTQPVSLSSSLTYSLTKKRMIMMKKHTPRLRAILKKTALLPLFAMLIFLFSDKAVALSGFKNSIPHFLKKPGAVVKDTPKDIYYKGATVKYKSKSGVITIKKYDDMTAEEKDYMPIPLPPPPKKIPTEALLNQWKGSDKYGVWVDGKHIANKDLDNYKASDFVLYWNSRLLKKAQHYGNRRFQIDLLSPGYYDESYIKPRAEPGKKIVVFESPRGRFPICVADFSISNMKVGGVVFAK